VTTVPALSTPVERIEAWTAALRSGKYKQAQGRLRRGDSFCCLGVACDVYDPSKWDRHLYLGRGGTLPVEVASALGIHPPDERKLEAMNDGDFADFGRIARYIETEILPRVRKEQESKS
jgi:hypothetical protein